MHLKLLPFTVGQYVIAHSVPAGQWLIRGRITSIMDQGGEGPCWFWVRSDKSILPGGSAPFMREQLRVCALTEFDIPFLEDMP